MIKHQSWLWERALGDTPLNAAQRAELEELRSLLIARKASVSGRTLWLGGTAVSRKREASMFNPCHPDTAFITSEGVKTFRDFKHGDVTEVLTHKGRWRSAVISDAGTQPLYEVTFQRNGAKQVGRFSAVHKWLLADGETRVTTTEVVGKRLAVAPFDFYDWSFDSAPLDEQVYWASGYIYGDGAVDAFGNARVRLCGAEKDKHLAKFVTLNCPYSFPPSANGDAFVYFGKYGKVPPARGTEPRLLRAFIQGYMAADGSKDGNYQTRHGELRYSGILVANKEAQEFVRWAFPVVGLYILSERQPIMTTNFGPRNPDTKMFGLATVPGEWRVSDIRLLGDENVWCLTVDEDETFVLASGIVSGNCAFTKVETVHDVVDAFWLLLQGCGVGFEPVVGTLNGFSNELEVEVIRSQRHLLEQKHGRETNLETHSVEDGKRVWTISVGDSAEAWAKSVGKLLAGKKAADLLRIDLSQIRPAGERLKGYGWVSSGDEVFYVALQKIAAVLNRRAGRLLSRIDILDVMNLLGTTLSSRRSAEIALVPYGDAEWEEFARAKKDFWLHGNEHRQQSNNSLVFAQKPTREELVKLFDLMKEAGGSEPGFINGEAAKKRAPWFSGVNPCAEILLPNKGFCNLVEINLSAFNGQADALRRAVWILARANYRQTCVNLRDGILQSAWHENNEFLRLCGVGVTGVVGWEHQHNEKEWVALSFAASLSADSMAEELGLPYPKAVTTIKPSGTLSKVMDTTEGIHKPLGKYIFNNVRFSKHDPMVKHFRKAGYKVFNDPTSADAVLITFPTIYEGVKFDVVNGVEVNLESAVEQLERYKRVMENYVDHNCSITVSYSVDEVPAIIDWLLENWDTYVGVSFIYRNDPTKSAADLGYLYLPQEVVTKEVYDAYVGGLQLVAFGAQKGKEAENDYEIDTGSECATGACPIR